MLAPKCWCAILQSKHGGHLLAVCRMRGVIGQRTELEFVVLERFNQNIDLRW